MNLIPARLKDQQLLEEVETHVAGDSHFHLWWLGQSGYLLLWKGKKILLDPYLSDSLTEKYASTGKPHVRMSERVVDPALLNNISVVTSSHNHTDHLDAGTLIPLIANNPDIRMIIPEANRKFVAERIKQPDSFPVGINAGESVTIGDFTFHGIPACHNEVEKDEGGRCRFMGYVISFGDWNIYHSGDTLWFDGIEEWLRPFRISLAILPINGNDPARGVAGNLNAVEAVALGKAIGAGAVIPCHYDMFTFNTADPDDFIKEAIKAGQPFKVLPPGGYFSSKFFA